MSEIFHVSSSLTSLNVVNFNTENTDDISDLFTDIIVRQLSLNWNTKNVKNSRYIFRYLPNVVTIFLSASFDTSKETTMKGMFYEYYNLKAIDISNFNIANVENFSNFFSDCYELESLDTSNFNTNKVKDMDSMFNG